MKYKLDLTSATLPSWFPENFPRELIVEDGKHSMLFDARLTEREKDILLMARIKANLTCIDYSLPIGFDMLPVGAKLEAIEE